MWTEQIFKISPGVRLCVVRVPEWETDDSELRALTAPADLARYEASSPRRQAESRAAAAALCRLLTAESPQRAGKGVLSHLPGGAPVLSHGLGYCSLSHDLPLAAAALADRPVGVDLLRRGRPASRPLSRLMDAGPVLNRLAPELREEAAAVLWTQLEAWGKLLGVGLNLKPTDLPRAVLKDGRVTLEKEGAVFVTVPLETAVLSAAYKNEKETPSE